MDICWLESSTNISRLTKLIFVQCSKTAKTSELSPVANVSKIKISPTSKDLGLVSVNASKVALSVKELTLKRALAFEYKIID